jgi:hypothetical protein
MGTATGFLTLHRLAKGFFAALALLAVTLALASPVCDAFDLPGDIHQEDCCASLADETPVPPAAAPSGLKPPVFAPLPAVWSPQWRAVAWSAAAIPPDRPPLTRPYHARSARLLI